MPIINVMITFWVQMCSAHFPETRRRASNYIANKGQMRRLNVEKLKPVTALRSQMGEKQVYLNTFLYTERLLG